MSEKSIRHHHNQQTESRRLDHDLIEQRALQIARDEGRDAIDSSDRTRAKEELLAPNEVDSEAPEITSDMDPRVTAWDESPDSSGKSAVKVPLEDEASVGKELFEKGLRGPRT